MANGRAKPALHSSIDGGKNSRGSMVGWLLKVLSRIIRYSFAGRRGACVLRPVPFTSHHPPPGAGALLGAFFLLPFVYTVGPFALPGDTAAKRAPARPLALRNN